MTKRFAMIALVTMSALSGSGFAQNAGKAGDVKPANTLERKKVAVSYVPESEAQNGGPSVLQRAGSPFLAKQGRNVGANILVNAPQLGAPLGRFGRSETIIATDPSGQYLLAGWNDAEGFCGAPFGAPCNAPPVPGLSGYGWSTNGGATWTDGGTPFTHTEGGLTWMTRGDPWMNTGGAGEKTYYYANMARPVVDPSAFGLTGLLVHRGNFSTSGFSFNQSTLIQPTNNGVDTYDKECVAAGKTGGTMDRVVVAVTNFIEVFGIPFYGYGQIETYTSDDQAASFPKRAIVQADETAPDGSGVVNQGAAAVIGDDGTIYVAWERGWLAPYFFGPVVWPQIVFAKSTDGGVSFGPRVLVSDISSGALFPPAGYNRTESNDFPRIAYDANFKNDDHSDGRLYVSYHDSRIANGGTQADNNSYGNGNTDVYLRYSSDDGATWSAPTLIAGGPTAQFWPAVSVQPDGTVDVVWYQNDDGLTDVYYAASTDGGVTFHAPVRVTSASTDWTTVVAQIRPNFGDYIGIASKANRAFACWGDGRPDNHPNIFVSPIAWGTPKDGTPAGTLPASVTLEQNYPNPFNPSTSIGFSLPVDSPVSLTVYNAMGQRVATLVDAELKAGSHRYTFDADKLSGGAYMYKLIAGDHVETKTMVLIK